MQAEWNVEEWCGQSRLIMQWVCIMFVEAA